MDPRRIAIVPHTHWDREWYAPFQTFRMKLVETIDALLDLLERDPSYTHFLLDGQMAVVDDYLEIRPENEGRLRALAEAGRIAMGPWYVLMDEFLVSGETIVRDLQRGIERGESFGGVMEVGYLPDMFGHIAQMPQLLAKAGFSDAVLWRGVPRAIEKTGFDWEAPDGSVVRAEFLPVGYGNGASLPEGPDSLLQRIADHVDEIGSFLYEDLLFMNGSDHLAPQAFLGQVVAEANERQGAFHLKITTLADHLARAPRKELPRWRGELRSGARANVLMGVTSNRVDVKRAVALAERSLERRAEPAGALFLPADRYPEQFLELAWLEMIRNAAHDSICACSVDEVVNAVLERYAQAHQLAEGVAERAVSALAREMPRPGTFVLNLASVTRSGVIEAVVSGDDLDESRVQVLSERTGLPGTITLDATTVKTVLGMIQGPKIDNDAWIQSARVEEDDSGIHLTVAIGPEENPEVNIGQAKGDLYTKLGARPEAPVFVSLDQPRIRRILARATQVPGFGWAPLAPSELHHRVTGTTEDGVRLGNGLVEVLIDETAGTFALNGLGGFGRLVDVGDLGDSYNFSPPAHEVVVDEPIEVEVRLIEQGPVRASAMIRATYEWPDHIDGGSQRRVGSHRVTVLTTVSVHADERTVRVVTTFTNPARDHRLRVHLPLPEPAAHSVAECAFHPVTRGLVAEGRPDELGLPTFPSRRFVSAGGLTVIHEGLNEYELIDIEGGGAHSLALTLLRATGMLSRLGMTNRPLPAGPLTAVEGLQLVGRTIESRYALVLGDVDPYRLADEVLVPLETATSLGGGARPAIASALEVSGAEVSSVRRRAGALEVRLFNPSGTPTTAVLRRRRGEVIDLRGRPIRAFDEEVPLGAHEIVSLRLEELN